MSDCQPESSGRKRKASDATPQETNTPRRDILASRSTVPDLKRCRFMEPQAVTPEEPADDLQSSLDGTLPQDEAEPDLHPESGPQNVRGGVTRYRGPPPMREVHVHAPRYDWALRQARRSESQEQRIARELKTSHFAFLEHNQSPRTKCRYEKCPLFKDAKDVPDFTASWRICHQTREPSLEHWSTMVQPDTQYFHVTCFALLHPEAFDGPGLIQLCCKPKFSMQNGGTWSSGYEWCPITFWEWFKHDGVVHPASVYYAFEGFYENILCSLFGDSNSESEESEFDPQVEADTRQKAWEEFDKRPALARTLLHVIVEHEHRRRKCPWPRTLSEKFALVEFGPKPEQNTDGAGARAAPPEEDVSDSEERPCHCRRMLAGDTKEEFDEAFLEAENASRDTLSIALKAMPSDWKEQ